MLCWGIGVGDSKKVLFTAWKKIKTKQDIYTEEVTLEITGKLNSSLSVYLY